MSTVPIPRHRRRGQRHPFANQFYGLGADDNETLSAQVRRVAGTGASMVGAAAGGLVKSVVIRSAVSPDVYLDPRDMGGPGQGQPRRRGGLTEGLMAFVKPEIEVETAAGPIYVAPWGRPRTNWFWPVVIVGAAGTGALLYLAAKGLRK